jgi:hypothetical protein
MNDSIEIPALEILLGKLLAVFPSQSEALRDSFFRPLAQKISNGKRTMDEIGAAYILATDLYDAGDENRKSLPLYTHGQRILTSFLPHEAAIKILPFLTNPKDRMTKFEPRSIVMQQIRKVEIASPAFHEFFPGMLADRIADQTLSPGKFARAYLAAAEAFRNEPLFSNEKPDTNGKRDIQFLFDGEKTTLKIAKAVMLYSNATRATNCITALAAQMD